MKCPACPCTYPMNYDERERWCPTCGHIAEWPAPTGRVTDVQENADGSITYTLVDPRFESYEHSYKVLP